MANLGIIGADPSEPPSHEAAIILANRLLNQFNIPDKIECLEDIGASLFVVLYENLFSDRLPGIIRQPTCKDDEIHNCHIVIDILSTDVVHDNLSHIRAEDVVSGDITAISNLLDIFSYLLEYVINKIDSDAATDNEDLPSSAGRERDVLNREPMSSRVRSGRGVSPRGSKTKGSTVAYNKTNNNGARSAKTLPMSLPSSRSKNSNGVNINENHAVISHEDFYAMSHGGISSSFLDRVPSPIGADHSQSLLGQKSVDSDFEQEKWERKLQTNVNQMSTKVAWEEKPLRESQAGMSPPRVSPPSPPPVEAETDAAVASVAPALSTAEVVVPPATATSSTQVNTSTNQITSAKSTNLKEQEKSMPSTGKSFSASMPVPVSAQEKECTQPLRSTVGPIYHSEHSTPEKRPQASRRTATTIKGFSSSYDDLRLLVEKTAALTRVALDTSPVRTRAERDLDITDVSRDRPRPHISSDSARLARELNALGLKSSGKEDRQQPPERVNKKVAFLASESESSFQDGLGSYRSPLSTLSNFEQAYAKRGEAEDFGVTEAGYRGRMNDNRRVRVTVQDNVAYETSSGKPGKGGRLAKHLARNRQPELGAAHMTLRTEDRALRRKQEILRRMYDEDIDEFAEEVNLMMDDDAKASHETYDKYIRQCLEGIPKKKTTAKKGTATGSTIKKRKVGGAKPVQRRIPPTKTPAGSEPLRVSCEEDLLPILLEEFPHLHMSEHTWHELWRKGLHQIEALTTAYKASQKKKSRAQSQLEEAADRHELLANIMRKQLEHTKRVRDVKAQKQQQVHLRNRMHEKRAQSARARRYYNEYQVRSRGKQLKKRTKEEMVFRELFQDALQIQKERIKDIRQYASDKRQCQETRRQNEIESMENFYHNQFAILCEKLTKERKETEIRDSAQQKMMDRLKRELRQKMEEEIKQYQEEMFRDEDDAHFRQMDADRIRRRLHLAQYSAKI